MTNPYPGGSDLSIETKTGDQLSLIFLINNWAEIAIEDGTGWHYIVLDQEHLGRLIECIQEWMEGPPK